MERRCDAAYVGQIQPILLTTRVGTVYHTPELRDSSELLQRHEHTRQRQADGDKGSGAVCMETPLCLSLCKCLHSFSLMSRPLLKINPGL